MGELFSIRVEASVPVRCGVEIRFCALFENIIITWVCERHHDLVECYEIPMQRLGLTDEFFQMEWQFRRWTLEYPSEFLIRRFGRLEWMAKICSCCEVRMKALQLGLGGEAVVEGVHGELGQ